MQTPNIPCEKYKIRHRNWVRIYFLFNLFKVMNYNRVRSPWVPQHIPVVCLWLLNVVIRTVECVVSLGISSMHMVRVIRYIGLALIYLNRISFLNNLWEQNPLLRLLHVGNEYFIQNWIANNCLTLSLDHENIYYFLVWFGPKDHYLWATLPHTFDVVRRVMLAEWLVKVYF